MPRNTLSLIACLFLASHTAQALQIRTYTDSRHLRFDGFPGGPTANTNTNFIARNVDLSGVGWYVQDTRRQYTLVSPKHFVGANHFKPSTSGQLKFLATDGTVRTYEVDSTHSILNDDGDPTDLFIGTLEEVIAASDLVNFQPYLSLPSESSYSGQSVLFVGHHVASPKNLRIGSGIIGSFTNLGADPVTSGSPFNSTRAYQMTYSNIGFGGDDAFAESGDSGSPSLVAVDGIGAIVGTHSAVANASVNIGLAIPGSTITYDSFVPHYIEELNAIMEPDGYHMTRAVPGATKPSTTLDLTVSQPTTIRAGYPFSLTLGLANTGLSEDANNIKIITTLPAAPAASGTLWINSSTDNSLTALRGGIDSQSSADDLTIQLSIPQAGSFNTSVNFSADEFPGTSQAITIHVVESFKSWSASLIDQSQTGDDDSDNIVNLLEYAFGGDPATNSQLTPDASAFLLPKITENGETFTIEYLRRKDAVMRGLSDEILRSSGLTSGSWVSAIPDSTSTASFNEDLEKVTATFATSAQPAFFRVAVSLSE